MANESELWSNAFNSSDDYISLPFEDNHHPRYPQYPVSFAVGLIFVILIIVGVFTNVLGLASLVHFRMWLKHEGYFYLVAMFAANIGILLFDSTSYCISHWNFRYFPPDSSEFMCRIWHFLMTIHYVNSWLSVALLFNVYLREHLTQRRRCGCPVFAAKYCTLFASKIVVGIIFGVNFIFGLTYIGLFTLHDSDYGMHCNAYGFLLQYIVIFFVHFSLMWVLPLCFFLPVILLLTLCISHDGAQFGFSGIEERSLAADHFRTFAVTLSSTNLFSSLQSIVLTIGLNFDHLLGYVAIPIQTAFCISICFQPVFCFIVLKEFRKGVLRKLRDLGCCKCLPQRCWPSGDALRFRLQELEEQPEQQE